MPLARDSFCSYCGTRYTEPHAYPRTCPGCAYQTWANPIPVCVTIVPVVDGERTGVLVVRRNLPPAIGKLALPGGFLEEHEAWNIGAAREVVEETGVVIDPDVEQLHWRSSRPRPNRLLLFSVAKPVDASTFPAFEADAETQERGVIFGPDGLDEEFAFDLHVDATKRYFASRDVTGPHAFARR
ncbi:MAG: NUDIX domain-containing protein [Kofleriaceae bacterium]